jgi:DNA-directed RNA polymerase specialized sigma24 family protein
VAKLLVILAGDALEAFGRASYGECIRAVVGGLPDLPNGKPALDLVQDVQRRGADALPAGYGKPFAVRVFKILISRFGDHEIAEEAMSHVLLQSARGKIHIRSGSSLQEAEAMLIVVALNGARDALRARNRRREQPLLREDDNAQTTMDIEDPLAFQQLDKLLPASEIRSLLRDLAEVHPRAPDWLQARLQGDSGQDIAIDWGTTPSYISKWQRTYVPQIRKRIEHHLRQARSRYSYDWRGATPKR